MIRPKIALASLIVLYVLLAGLVAATSPRMPDRVATHFDAAGRPNGWSSRAEYLAFSLIFPVALSVFTAGPLYLSRHLGDSAVNLPNKDYWLSPERRAQTFDDFFSLGLGIAGLTMGLMLGMFALLIQANLSDPVRLPPASGFALMAVYIGLLTAFIGAVIWRFWRVP